MGVNPEKFKKEDEILSNKLIGIKDKIIISLEDLQKKVLKILLKFFLNY